MTLVLLRKNAQNTLKNSTFMVRFLLFLEMIPTFSYFFNQKPLVSLSRISNAFLKLVAVLDRLDNSELT